MMLRHRMTNYVAAVALALTGSHALAGERIVSTNLCADQFLALLAHPAQVAGVTPYARDRAMSAYAERMADLPVVAVTLENVLAREPDLVLAAQRRRTGLTAQLARYGIAIVPVDMAHDLDGIFAQIRTVAAAIGREARGEAVITEMTARLDRLPRPEGRTLVAAYYQRRGFLTGTGTLIDDIMARAGFVNLAEQLGRPAIAQLSIEDLVHHRPDLLIVESEALDAEDQGARMLEHPALAHIPKLVLPQSWTVCGSPRYVDAVESLIAQSQGLR